MTLWNKYKIYLQGNSRLKIFTVLPYNYIQLCNEQSYRKN